MTRLQPLEEFLSLYAELIRSTPLHAFAVIALSICAQVAFIALLLLPWKLLLVIHGGELPVTITSPLGIAGQKHQVIIIGAAILLALAIHIGCELATRWACHSGARRICELHNKISLFQSKNARDLYTHLLRALAALFFCSLAALCISAIYPSLLAALAIYLAACCLTWRLLVAPCPERRRKLSEHLPLLLKFWWQIGFLLTLAWVLLNYSLGTTPAILILFTSLILTRQLLVMCTDALLHGLAVYRENTKALALFLPQQAWRPSEPREDDFQTLLTQEKREKWIGDLLCKHRIQTEQPSATRCRLAESGNIAYINFPPNKDTPPALLFKLHSHAYESSAEQEWDLLERAEPHWPAPVPIARHRVQDHWCLSYEWHASREWMDSRERSRYLPELRVRLLGCDIGQDLEARHDRTHLPLPERMRNICWDLLRAFAHGKSAKMACKNIEEKWPELAQSIACLPRQLLLPRLQNRLLARDIDSNGNRVPLLYDWNRWRWEPLGSGYPLGANSKSELENILTQATAIRPELKKISVDKVHFVARIHEFERRYTCKNYTGALNMLDGILNNMNK